MNKLEALSWVTRQWQRLSGKDEISGVGGMFCESFARTDVRGETIVPRANVGIFFIKKNYLQTDRQMDILREHSPRYA